MSAARARSGWLGLAVLLALTAGCEPHLDRKLADHRAFRTLPALMSAPYLQEAARATSQQMCTTGVVTATPDPTATYTGETAVAVEELVGAAVLDPARGDPVTQDVLATDDIWMGWEGDERLLEERWDEVGVGEHVCDDGRLYMTLLLRERPTMPATGLYSTPVHPATAITTHSALEYGQAIDHRGNQVSLLLDVYTPPPTDLQPRPVLLYVHGGGFSSGSRTSFASSAVQYARRGFVVVSIDYRLRPNETLEELLAAAQDAIDDAMEAVRWVKANAAAYGIDPGRIAALGSSAGGATVLGLGHVADPTPGGPLAAFDPSVRAVVSTGAHLTPGLDLIDFEPTDAPTMMFHYEQDTSAGQATWDYAFETCRAIREAGPPCDFIRQAGSGHTISLGPTSTWWTWTIGPFLWHHLDLAG